MDAQKSVSMFKRTDSVRWTYVDKKYLQARANLSVCPLSNTHMVFKSEFCKFKEPHKQTGISKQQEAALEKQREDRPWKSSQKNHTSNNFINYNENCILFDLKIPFAAWEANWVFQY